MSDVSAPENGVFEADRDPLPLEDEGELAADYLEELLDIADLEGDIDIEVRNGRVYLTVAASSGANLGVLAKPDVVKALQELTRLAVMRQTGDFSRLILDIGGSRNTREQELSALVESAIGRLESGAARAELPPMTSYERKIVHDLVADRGYTSESHGEGSDRHPVITRA